MRTLRNRLRCFGESVHKPLPVYDNLEWENLAEAVIMLACKDYRKAYRRHLTHPTKETETELNRERKFFRSDWFNVLTTLDGETILSRLEEEVRNTIKKVNVVCKGER
jgi:hypothetical protein